MAQLGKALRITFTSVRVEAGGGPLPWQRRSRDQSVYLAWRAENPAGVVAEGSITLAEVRRWKAWFGDAEQVKTLSRKLGKAPTDPVARLWTPLAGQTVEFFVWPEATGTLALLALFVPNQSASEQRIAAEMSAKPEDLAAFGSALEAEADALAGQP